MTAARKLAVPRTRAKALQLRARANEAREALDKFEGDPIDDPQDRARWDLLVKVVGLREAEARRAEEAEAKRPHVKQQAEAERVKRARAEETSGTVLQTDATGAHVERLAACRGCGRCVELRGDPERLRAEGWGSRRDTTKTGWPRLWWCPECWAPPRLELEGAPEPYAPPAAVLELGKMRSHAKARGRLERELRGLAVVDKRQAESILARLIYSADSKAKARRWRAFAGELGLSVGALPAPARAARGGKRC
jgi:hypothetical protein